jgi:hypothetical protein
MRQYYLQERQREDARKDKKRQTEKEIERSLSLSHIALKAKQSNELGCINSIVCDSNEDDEEGRVMY